MLVYKIDWIINKTIAIDIEVIENLLTNDAFFGGNLKQKHTNVGI